MVHPYLKKNVAWVAALFAILGALAAGSDVPVAEASCLFPNVVPGCVAPYIYRFDSGGVNSVQSGQRVTVYYDFVEATNGCRIQGGSWTYDISTSSNPHGEFKGSVQSPGLTATTTFSMHCDASPAGTTDAPSFTVVVGPGGGCSLSSSTGNLSGVPTGVTAGSTFTPTVPMFNSSSCSWDSSWKLVPVGSSSWGQGGGVSSASTPQGAWSNFTFVATAPSTAGTYTFEWQMRSPSGVPFGAISKSITVTVTPPQGGDPVGQILSVDNNTGVVNGVACDPDNYGMAIDVALFMDGPPDGSSWARVGQTNAGLNNNAAAAKCKGTIGHGFNFTMPPGLHDGKVHTLYVYGLNIGSGGNGLLDGFGWKFQLAAASYNPDGLVNIDSNAGAVSGYACDGDNWAQPTTVDLYVNGPPGGASWAYLDRVAAGDNNPAAAGTCSGTTNHGFTYNLPDWLKDGQPHTVYVYGLNIGGGSISLLKGSGSTFQWGANWPILTTGQITDENGNPVAGTVAAHSDPPTVSDGDTVDEPVVGTATSDASGNYVLKVDPNNSDVQAVLTYANANNGGSVDFDITAASGDTKVAVRTVSRQLANGQWVANDGPGPPTLESPSPASPPGQNTAVPLPGYRTTAMKKSKLVNFRLARGVPGVITVRRTSAPSRSLQGFLLPCPLYSITKTQIQRENDPTVIGSLHSVAGMTGHLEYGNSAASDIDVEFSSDGIKWLKLAPIHIGTTRGTKETGTVYWDVAGEFGRQLLSVFAYQKSSWVLQCRSLRDGSIHKRTAQTIKPLYWVGGGLDKNAGKDVHNLDHQCSTTYQRWSAPLPAQGGKVAWSRDSIRTSYYSSGVTAFGVTFGITSGKEHFESASWTTGSTAQGPYVVCGTNEPPSVAHTTLFGS